MAGAEGLAKKGDEEDNKSGYKNNRNNNNSRYNSDGSNQSLHNFPPLTRWNGVIYIPCLNLLHILSRRSNRIPAPDSRHSIRAGWTRGSLTKQLLSHCLCLALDRKSDKRATTRHI